MIFWKLRKRPVQYKNHRRGHSVLPLWNALLVILNFHSTGTRVRACAKSAHALLNHISRFIFRSIPHSFFFNMPWDYYITYSQTSEENKKTWEKVKSYKFQQKNQFILQPLKDKSSPALKRGNLWDCVLRTVCHYWLLIPQFLCSDRVPLTQKALKCLTTPSVSWWA